MSESVKFSIIIPSYNVESYIQQTIQSVLKQSYCNYEIIIVDDGSSDDTVKIIHNIKDERIKLIKTKHAGVSAARNVGLKNASGDYVVFVDSDDYIEDWILGQIAKKISRKPDVQVFVGMFNITKEDEKLKSCHSERLNKFKINNRSQADVLEYFYRVRLIFTVWRFIVKRDLIINNNLYFEDGLLHEDEDWVTRMLLSSDNFQLIEQPFYNYRIHKNSIMQREDKNHIRLRHDSRYKIAMKFVDMADSVEEQYKKNFLYRCAYKNVQQVYRELKKNANPLPPIRTRCK